MNNLYLNSRKLHRILVLVVLLLTLIMAGTGMLLKYTFIGNAFGIDLILIRYLHNTLSTYFGIVLILMAGTGLVMYVTPLLRRKKKEQI